MAGTVTAQHQRTGTLQGAWRAMVDYPFEFTADAADGSFPQVTLSNVTGYLAKVSVKFDADSPPSGLDVQVADFYGIDQLGGNGAGFTGSGKVTLSPPEQIVEQLTIDLSGNTTNSAKVTVILHVF